MSSGSSQYLEVTIVSGEAVDTLPAGSFVVEVCVDEAISKKSVKSGKSDGTELKFAHTGELKCTSVPSDLKATVKLLKTGIKSTEIAVGTMDLGQLASGSLKVEEAVMLASPEDQTDMLRVEIAVAWKEGYGPNQTMGKGKAGDDEGDEDDDKKEADEKEQKKRKIKLTPLPNCEFQDYSVRVRVHKARNLQSTKQDKNYDPLVQVDVGSESQRTDYINDTNNPTFEDELVFTFTKVEKDFWTKPITIGVYDHKTIGSNKRIGAAQLDCAAVYRENSEHFMAHRWFALLKGVTEGNVMGFLKCSVAVLHTRDDAVPDDLPDPNEGDEEAIVNSLVAGPGAMFENIFLEFDLFSAEGLPVMDPGILGGKADPYVKLAYGTKKVKTAYILNTLEPEWNTSLTLPITYPPLTGNIVLSVFDHDKIGSDEVIARHRWTVHELKPDSDPETLPRLTPRFINLYGLPREMDPGPWKWYNKMADGEVPGVEYRGRVLLGMEAFRGEKGTRETVPVITYTVDVVVLVQVLLLNMIPSGKYHLRLTIGENEMTTQPRRAEKMHGNTTKMHYVYFNEEMMVRGSFQVTPPPGDYNKPEAFCTRQLPDAILSLVEDPIVKGPLFHATEPYAFKRFPMEHLVREGRGVSCCECIPLNQDTSEVSAGAQPVAPMVQMVAGAYIARAQEELRVKPRQAVPMPGLSTGDTKKYLLEVCIYHAENIPSGDSNGLSDPYIRISFGNGTAQTGHKRESLNPTYNEMLRVEADLKPRQQFPDIVVEIWDWDRIGSDTFLARKIVDFKYSERPEYAGKFRWVEGFVDNLGRPVDTRVVMSFEVILGTASARKSVPKQVDHRRKPGKSTDTYKGYPIPEKKRMEMAPFEVRVKLHALRNMKKFRLRAIQDPSVYMQFMEQVFAFEKKEGPNPTYNFDKIMKMLLPKDPVFLPRIQVLAYDHRMGSKVLVGGAADSLMDNFYHPRKRDADRLKIDEDVTKRFDKMFERKFAKPRSAAALRKLEKKEKRHRKRAEAVQKAMAMLADKKRLEEEALRQEAEAEAAAMGVKGGSKPPSASRAGAATAGPGSRSRAAIDVDGDGINQPLLGGGGGSGDDNGNGEMSDRGGGGDASGFNDASSSGGETSATDASDLADGEEAKWFEKYDAAEVVAMADEKPTDLNVRFDDIVTRLTLMRGKCYLPKSVDPTAENYFGPFDDFKTLGLTRGWGEDVIKAGAIRFDASLEPLKGPAEYEECEHNTGKVDDAKGAGPSGGLGGGAGDDGEGSDAGDEVQYMARVYVISCANLTAMDFGPLGGSSDPYIKMELMSEGMDKDARVRVKCDDEKSMRFCTLNPEYYLVRELTGSLPQHNTLRVTVMDHDTIGSDDKIGHTDINVEDRYMGRRAYARFNPATGGAYNTMVPGSYVEKRQLFDDNGARAGTIEMWVDIFPTTDKPPAPIDITPPPPIEVEVRATVWATRDVELVNAGLSEDSVDVYIRSHMEGMKHDMQKTDVNYRSTDGSATFDWLKTYPLMFDARKNKVFPIQKEETFTIFKKEPKRMKPSFIIEVMNNNTFFSDDFIGTANVDLLDVRSALTRRDMEAFVRREPRCPWYCNCWPWSKICRKKVVLAGELGDRQRLAAKEFEEEKRVRQERVDELVDAKMKAIEDAPPGMFSDRVKRKLRDRFEKEVKNDMRVNVFDSLGPKRKKKELSKPKPAAGEDDDDPEADKSDPRVIETPKFWIACRGPKGNNRVGDVQVSFALVKAEDIKRDMNLASTKGRIGNDVDRPEQPSFLKNPTKAAYQIIWRNYKYYIITAICLLLSLIYLLLLTKRILDHGTEEFF